MWDDMTDAFTLTATEAIQEINKGELSRHEWVKSCLKRIKQNP